MPEHLAEATILVVDDEPINLQVLSRLLRPTYTVRAATSGERALQAATSEPRPDLILLDVMMPGMDGFQVLEQLRAVKETREIPVVFVTALAGELDEEHGLAAGATDYIAKPIKPAVVLARVRTQLEAKWARDWMRGKADFLEAEVARRMAENDLIQLVSVRALAHLAETRDPETGNHILRTQAYVHELAVRLRRLPRFASVITDRYLDLLTRSAPLHDIGKVGIPDTILLKPGPLDAQEWAVMKTHARLGSDAIERAERDAAMPVAFLGLAKDIAHWHHERWDGSGYPDGLAGEAIPLAARIMALADVFDALVSPRVYKAPLPIDKVREIIAAGRGKHFDPDLADTFLEGFDSFVALAQGHRDMPAAAAAQAPVAVSTLALVETTALR